MAQRARALAPGIAGLAALALPPLAGLYTSSLLSGLDGIDGITTLLPAALGLASGVAYAAGRMARGHHRPTRHEDTGSASALDTEHRRLRSILSAANTLLLVVGPDGEILQAGEYAKRELAIGGHSPVGLGISDVFGGLPLNRLDQLAQRGPEEGREVWTVFRGGKLRTFDVRAVRWEDAGGAVRYTVHGYDATRQTDAAKVLEETNMRWLTALDGSGIGVFEVDLETGVSIVNETWWRILGLVPEEKANPQQVFLSRLHKDDLRTMQDADRACIEQHAPISINEVRVRHGSGKWVWIRTHASVCKRDAQGRALRLIGTQFDVTQLKTAESQLQESLEMFRVAHQGAPVGIALMTSSGQFTKVNKSLCTLLGRIEKDLVGTACTEVAAPDDGPAVEAMIEDALRQGQTGGSREFRLRHRNGTEIWVRVAMSTVRAARQRRRLIVATFEDISSVHALDVAKSEFVSNVSHELRTPLTAIRGALGLMRATGVTDGQPKPARMLDIASNNCEHLIVLVNDILDMEKLASGKMEFAFDWQPLAELIDEAMDANQTYAQQCNVTLVSERIPDDVEVHADATRFRQVLSNLLSNAAKFSPAGSRVVVRAAVTGDELSISVIDKGPGIPEDMQQTIFDRFSQIRRSQLDKQAGTGLGLNIAQRIMDAHGGRIELESTLGAGSEFRLVLPCRTAEAEPLRKAG